MSETTTAGSPVTMPTGRVDFFDPPAEFRELRATPVCRMRYPDGHVGWLVTGHGEARTVLSDPRFSARAELRRSPIPRPGMDAIYGHPAPPGYFLAMDPPEQTRFRKPLTAHFTVRRMAALHATVERLFVERVDAMIDAGQPSDLVADFALPVPSLVICELLGVPDADRAEFQRNAIVHLGLTSTAEESAAALRSIVEYVQTLARHKRDRPGDDLVSHLVTTTDLSDVELGGAGLLLLLGGHETTTNMLTLGTFALLRNPAQLRLLVADPGRIPAAVEELLRYLSIVQFSVVRTAIEDVDIDGIRIAAGETVTVSLPAGNRDPRKFASPDVLDIERATAGHLAFGHGVHQCIGQQLARVEMRAGFATLLGRLPDIRLAVPDDEVELGYDLSIYGVHRMPVTWGDGR
ncbi:cytochrome P450 [Pseudonocardia xishanensis]|uniref:Cytochrome P450 n=2 Tax=Pseudonocardia xishanensis TaxID=630995 RepID=A0ABP8RVD3_9PSEU